MTGPSDIAHWRLQIFHRLLLVVLILGGATAVPSVLLAISEKLWLVAVIDTIAMLWLLAVWHWRSLPFSFRVFSFMAVTFAVGAALMLQNRPVSQIYLAAVPVLAALLLGLRPAYWWLAITGVAVLAISLLTGGGLITRPLIIAVNFVFITGIITLSCGVLLRQLAAALTTVSATAVTMELGRNELHALNNELRLTSAALARLNDMVLIAEVGPSPGQGAPVIFVNDAFERRSGYARAELLGQPLRHLSGPATSHTTLSRIEAAMARQEAVRAELLNYTRDGEPYWVETDMVPFADEGGNNTHWLVVERDITERRKSEDDIHRLAFYDVLTGLPNRRLLMDRIAKLLETTSRDGSYSGVMFIDLDHFKDINDARGHAVGDALLRHAGARLTALVRKGDTVARIGGDEFVVLLPGLGAETVEAAHHALMIAEKVRAALAEPFIIDGQSYQSGASLGATLFPGTGDTADDLLREADTAMYRAKADGRNGIVFYEEAMQTDVEQRLTLARSLALALGAGELQMHYQPQVDPSGRIAGAELLMRWQRADGSSVPPNTFIPIAEQSGLIHSLGHWAMREACLAVVQLGAAGHALPLSVNVSPSQFRQIDFVEQVRATLRETGAPAHLLILEVTEGLLIDKFDDTVKRMAELAALGLRFSIDDFGTGYSSLAYLRRMPLYELKIDRSFIHDTPSDVNGLAIVQAILAMARHLGLRVVAEGVETQAQADFLCANECDCMQGYLFARPAPFAQLLAAMADGVIRPAA
ncbi:bifunctional diguanylate cyclase/phosphodiesterase [Massilia sp. CF038]|uniref:putative bifunctional diguanylate cyclase/phosphodiesterase n=1 Tax=Massilia sp. CF038 TaxID=1881045 RepID=UPI00091A6752|nr:EAL domain-containing protein [Massilia sp. CF038]SHH71432.1 PAS domain S-box-containing protein/diguanylate cyclase (GGDEF) domain-containing protein [Massilia sp. CF038]